LTVEEHEELTSYLSVYRDAGDEIPGGARIIYYFYDDLNPLYAIFLFAKGEQVDMSPQQKKEATDFAARMKAQAKAKRKKQ
jgi:hypothetical protein